MVRSNGGGNLFVHAQPQETVWDSCGYVQSHFHRSDRFAFHNRASGLEGRCHR